ncbi:hypothetical protein T492DRAFT_392818 [Pavlovales sp. CCMP2436]|nr:hypothetical protein T492DRAFT_392818 [Pavlovales sp. CCMP2436]
MRDEATRPRPARPVGVGCGALRAPASSAAPAGTIEDAICEAPARTKLADAFQFTCSRRSWLIARRRAGRWQRRAIRLLAWPLCPDGPGAGAVGTADGRVGTAVWPRRLLPDALHQLSPRRAVRRRGGAGLGGGQNRQVRPRPREQRGRCAAHVREGGALGRGRGGGGAGEAAEEVVFAAEGPDHS